MHLDSHGQAESFQREEQASGIFSPPLIFTKPVVSKWIMVGVVLIPTLGRLPAAREAGSAISQSLPNSSVLVPTHRAMRELDRFLNHHPLLEERLRLQPRLALSEAFLEKNSAWREFLDANPQATSVVQLNPRYFLYRALLRQASVPIPFSEVSRFKELLDQEPPVEQQLTEHPESIRDPGFLKTYPAVQQFLLQNPHLAHVFIHDLNTL